MNLLNLLYKLNLNYHILKKIKAEFQKYAYQTSITITQPQKIFFRFSWNFPSCCASFSSRLVSFVLEEIDVAARLDLIRSSEMQRRGNKNFYRPVCVHALHVDLPPFSPAASTNTHTRAPPKSHIRQLKLSVMTCHFFYMYYFSKENDDLSAGARNKAQGDFCSRRARVHII